MVKGMATANHVAQPVDSSAPKRRRHRSKVPLKPKLPLVGTGKAASGSMHGVMVTSSAFSTIPRAMRARIERASIPSQPHKQANDANVTTDDKLKHQPLAKSNSGKTALGPWEREERVPQTDSGERSMNPQQKSFYQLTTTPVPRMGTNLKVHEEEMLLMQSKPLVKGNLRDRSSMRRGRGKHRIPGMITQPRRN